MKRFVRLFYYSKLFGRFVLPPKSAHKNKPQNDTICDALAIWEIIYSDNEFFDSVMRVAGGGVWAAREYVASSILPTIRHYYGIHGEDIDFDGLFIGPLIESMAASHWNMKYDYTAVCLSIRHDTWSDKA